jgi:predicted nucleic acid-binding protein
MTLVLDASAVVDVLLRTDRGEQVSHVLAQRADEDMVRSHISTPRCCRH